MRKILYIALTICLLCVTGLMLFLVFNQLNTSRKPEAIESTEVIIAKAETQPAAEENTPEAEAVQPIGTQREEGGPIYYGDIAIANKKHGMSASYAPGEDPEAAAAVAQLIQDMQNAGLDVSSSYSGFRSYEYQAELYNGYVAAHGQEAADTFSARPGYSEHQTGLAFDLKHSSGALIEGQAEADWIRDNAYKYGFILRYPEGKEEITGYLYEPWHIRYVGPEAQKIYESGLTLEEYLNIEGGTQYDEDGQQ